MPLSNDRKAPNDAVLNVAETKRGPPPPLSVQITGPGATQIDSMPLLAPRDTGLAAWRVLTAAILVQALPFGALVLRQCFLCFSNDISSLQASL